MCSSARNPARYFKTNPFRAARLSKTVFFFFPSFPLRGRSTLRAGTSPREPGRTRWTRARCRKRCSCAKGSLAKWDRPSGPTCRRRTPRSSRQDPRPSKENIFASRPGCCLLSLASLVCFCRFFSLSFVDRKSVEKEKEKNTEKMKNRREAPS